MTGDSVTVPLFATPFTTVNTGADGVVNARLAAFCETLREADVRAGVAPADPRRFRSREDFLESAGAAEIRQLILRHASTVVAGLNSLDAAEYGRLHVQARGWCSIVARHGHIPAQHFPGASWLAVYCVQAGESGGGALRIYERRLGSIYRDASTVAMRAPWRFGNHTWTPAPGRMALFPAHVPHEVSVVGSDTPLILVFAMLRFVDPDVRDGVKG